MALPELNDVPTLELASDGQHELEITRAREFTAQTGRICWRVSFRVMDEDTADDFQDLIAFPDEGDEVRVYRKMAQRAREFMEAFGLDAGMEASDVEGATGTAIVGRKDAYSGDGQENYVKRFS